MDLLCLLLLLLQARQCFSKFSDGYHQPSSKTSQHVEYFKQSCGLRPSERRQSRMVGARDSEYGEVPFQAIIGSVEVLGSWDKLCGGVLLTDRWVLTAAHCQGGWWSNMWVMLGIRDRTNKREYFKSKITRRVKQIVAHPNFNRGWFRTTISSINDIALIELDRPVKFNTNVQPICLPGRDDDFDGRIGLVSGWGAINYKKRKVPARLQVAPAKILNRANCLQAFHGIPRMLPNFTLCASFRLGQGQCFGDSGGPLMVKNEMGRWTLVGLISASLECCSYNTPGIMTNVVDNLDWIHNTIKSSGYW